MSAIVRERSQDPGRAPVFAFILAADQPGSLLESMICVTAELTRRLHPDAVLIVVSDYYAVAQDNVSGSVLARVADEVRRVPTPHGNAKFRSRYLKTTIRDHIRGDFVFLDADAVPVRPLYELFDIDADVAFALDRNVEPQRYRMDEWVTQLYATNRWGAPRLYFNSGVALYRDTAETRELFRQWHKLWNYTRQSGRDEDQPALNRVIDRGSSGVRVAVLPVRYNALVYLRPRSVRAATVIHFLTGDWDRRSDEVYYHLVQIYRQNGTVDDNLATQLLHHRYPWMDRLCPRRCWARGWYARAFLGIMRPKTAVCAASSAKQIGGRVARKVGRCARRLRAFCRGEAIAS